MFKSMITPVTQLVNSVSNDDSTEKSTYFVNRNLWTTFGAISFSFFTISAYGIYKWITRKGSSTAQQKWLSDAVFGRDIPAVAFQEQQLQRDGSGTNHHGSIADSMLSQVREYKNWNHFSNSIFEFSYPTDAGLTVAESSGLMGLEEIMCIVLREEPHIQLYFAIEGVSRSGREKSIPIRDYIYSAIHPLISQEGSKVHEERTDMVISGNKCFFIDISSSENAAAAHSCLLALSSGKIVLLFHLIYSDVNDTIEAYQAYRELFIRIANTIKLK